MNRPEAAANPKDRRQQRVRLVGISLCTSIAGCLVLTTWQIRRREEEVLQIIEK